MIKKRVNRWFTGWLPHETQWNKREYWQSAIPGATSVLLWDALPGIFLQAFVLVSVLARLMEEMAGRMGAQELTQLERVDEWWREWWGGRRPRWGWGPAGPSGGPVIGLGFYTWTTQLLRDDWSKWRQISEVLMGKMATFKKIIGSGLVIYVIIIASS